MKNYFYGWKKDVVDPRDFIYAKQEVKDTETYCFLAMPPRFDMRSTIPTVYDQGQLNSCTANAVSGILEYELKKRKTVCTYTPARLFIYYNTRYIESTVRTDGGASIRNTIKSLNVYGFADEHLWPYNPSKYSTKPLKSVYSTALPEKVLYYYRVNQTIDDIKSLLVLGYPIVFGFTVYSSFQSNAVALTGVVPMPAQSEYAIGGHAVVLVGFDDTTQRFMCRNSYGPDWGDNGFLYMPYAYVLEPNLASDFWYLKLTL